MTQPPLPGPLDPPPDRPSGLGGFLQTRYEHVDLGTHAGHRLRGHVRRRTLRLAIGHGRHLSLELGQVRPVAIEVTAGGTRYDVQVPAPTQPWLRLAWRVALLWLASAILVRLFHRARSASEGGDR